MNELIIRIQEDGGVSVEEYKDGIKSYKAITPDSLLNCINKSVLRGTVSSGLLPKGCLSYSAHDNGEKDICVLHQDNKADISYYDSCYPGFPLPQLVFGFHITSENRISQCKMGVVANESHLKPTAPMFAYPFGNVSGFHLCTGNNILPKCESLHTLGSLSYYILSMPNNNDHFKPTNNKLGLEMRDLLELLKDKQPEFYYSDILISYGKTLADFLKP